MLLSPLHSVTFCYTLNLTSLKSSIYHTSNLSYTAHCNKNIWRQHLCYTPFHSIHSNQVHSIVTITFISHLAPPSMHCIAMVHSISLNSYLVARLYSTAQQIQFLFTFYLVVPKGISGPTRLIHDGI